MQLSDSDKKTLYAAADILHRVLAADGDKVILRGFGTFQRKAKPARTARNPKDGSPIPVPARSVLHFSPSPSTTIEK